MHKTMKTYRYMIGMLLCVWLLAACDNSNAFDEYAKFDTTAQTAWGQSIVDGSNGYVAHVKSDRTYNLADGVDVLEMAFLADDGLAMQLFLFKIALSDKITLRTTLADDKNQVGTGQTIMKQLEAMQKNGKKVLGGTNADFFNTTTYIPYGVCYRDGVAVKTSFSRTDCNVFVITKDNEACCFTEEEYALHKDIVREAVCGRSTLLLKNGEQLDQSGNTMPVANMEPRTAIGVSQDGKEVYQGKNYMDGKYIQKVAPRTRRCEKPVDTKVVASLVEALRQCGAKDGMTFSFHHHLRDGDYVVNMVMAAAIEELGLKDLTIAATSLGSAHDPIAAYIEEGKVIGIQTSGIRGKMGEVVSAGKLKTPAIIRSHGGRPRAIEGGEVHIDIAFVAAPTSDCMGNCRGVGGKSDCGSLGYAMTDAKYADHVVVVTDCLVPFPNFPASVEAIDVDVVVVVDSIGNPKKIASAAARISQNPRDLMMAENVAKVIASTPYFKDGFSFQTGVGGPSLAANLFLEQYMDERNIKMGWAIGGICKPMVELLQKGKVGKVIDVQDFDLDAVNSIHRTPGHCEMSASQYANPANKGAFVNSLDFVVLAALEIDTGFNVNVLTGSDGVLRGAPGGHPDTAAGSKCCIIVTPLIRGRMATVCEHVVTVTTPGDCVDVLVTDYGIAVNPLRPDLIACLDAAGIPHVSIESLKEKAYSLVGRPDDLQWEDQVVAVLEARDGTILDVVRKIKPYDPDKD